MMRPRLGCSCTGVHTVCPGWLVSGSGTSGTGEILIIQVGIYSPIQDANDHSSGDMEIVKYMEDFYPPNYKYQQFGPQLTAEFFNATFWAELVAASGAKYFVFTSKHHDGFNNWPSKRKTLKYRLRIIHVLGVKNKVADTTSGFLTGENGS